MAKRKRLVFDLFLASALGLFVELVFIRWVASELRFFSFYKNIALIAAYLGMGLGFVIYSKERGLRSLFRIYLPLMILIVGIVLGLGRTLLSDILLSNRFNAQEYFWSGSIEELSSQIMALRQIALHGLLLGMFLLLALVFVPLGELVAAKFVAFRPLEGYSINVIGSVAGVLLYTGISFMSLPPAIWFFLAAAGIVYFILQMVSRSRWLAVIVAFIPAVMVLVWPNTSMRTIWSPYYRIDVQEKRVPGSPDVLLGYELSVNLAFHQEMVNLDPDFVSENYAKAPEYFDSRQAIYDAAYTAAPSLTRILIVGAGTGNDVAGALRAGAQEVVAVEIDPLILSLGKEFHPEKPYSNPAVTDVVEDARSFFTNATDEYDMIVFGFLDSHALFSPNASARLDNFVYTRESFSRVRDLLTDDGLLAISYGVPVENEWIGLRLYRTLTDAFGHPPQVYEFPTKDILFLIGRQPDSRYTVDDARLSPRPDYSYREDIPGTTDDWPYLYLRDKAIPSTHVIAILGIGILAFLLILRNLPGLRQFKPGFFFLGAGFFLLETKSVTEMALLFGSTWVVNAVVISAILLMIVLANIIVEHFKLSDTRALYVFLGLTLILSYFIPLRNFLELPTMLRMTLASLEQAAPLFFAAMIFAIRFRDVTSIPAVMGSNLFGGVLGGLTEYASLALGIRSLYLLALICYAFSIYPLAERSTEPRAV
jgi:hypothetical protein